MGNGARACAKGREAAAGILGVVRVPEVWGVATAARALADKEPSFASAAWTWSLDSMDWGVRPEAFNAMKEGAGCVVVLRCMCSARDKIVPWACLGEVCTAATLVDWCHQMSAPTHATHATAKALKAMVRGRPDRPKKVEVESTEGCVPRSTSWCLGTA